MRWTINSCLNRRRDVLVRSASRCLNRRKLLNPEGRWDSRTITGPRRSGEPPPYHLQYLFIYLFFFKAVFTYLLWIIIILKFLCELQKIKIGSSPPIQYIFTETLIKENSGRRDELTSPTVKMRESPPARVKWWLRQVDREGATRWRHFSHCQGYSSKQASILFFSFVFIIHFFF